MKRVTSLSIVSTIVAACLVELLLVSGFPGAAFGDDPPVASVNGQPITTKDLDTAIGSLFREAALKHLVLKSLIEQEAKKAGVSVSDAEVDAALKQWKQSAFGADDTLYGASLDQEGVTPKLYAEVLRENILVQRIASATTRLQDSDFDQVQVHPLVVRTLEEAQQVYDAVTAQQRMQPAPTLDQLMKQGNFTVEWRRPTSVLRYDARLDRNFLDKLFTLPIGSYAPPMAAGDGIGYEVLHVTGRQSGATFSAADRPLWANSLLREKTRRSVQDWWAAMEKQAQVIMAK